MLTIAVDEDMNITAPAKKFKFLPFFISILITLTIGFTASLFTRPQIAGWYSMLNKPSFNPPNWLFAPVWTSLYVMIAIAAYLVWERRDKSRVYVITVIIYVVQLALNFSWSLIFFGAHAILPALIVVLLLWVSIILNIRWFNKFSTTAAWLLVPYLLWVSFATALNLSIYLLN
ncbi:TspO/MBR family protein [Mucilaginibacter sp. L3T2-6]|uniref:TspO/MBR family protein n=1 Tax=Mucilaginibacter sp. L3T2-6 TaxID=3062491 RepID=UPI0026768D90|nr:TspO/MBR family protein [Mucilaginibacter sp. L3T2-6]MDO3641140.1 TspO/MBR family protein [Mucilaginibacter sp. L3T2-6]MDV6213384.1 TspO/MBR family protein [Mucilaginibacter sp. L3T2-6]